MTTFKPPKYLVDMQGEIETCTQERFLKIVESYKKYARFLLFLSDDDEQDEIEKYRLMSEGWLEVLEETAVRRFGIDLVKFTAKQLAQVDRDKLLVKYKLTDTSRGIYYGVKSKVKLNKLEANLYHRLKKSPPTSGQLLSTWRSLLEKIS